jgi:hypothetical protein
MVPGSHGGLPVHGEPDIAERDTPRSSSCHILSTIERLATTVLLLTHRRIRDTQLVMTGVRHHKRFCCTRCVRRTFTRWAPATCSICSLLPIHPDVSQYNASSWLLARDTSLHGNTSVLRAFLCKPRTTLTMLVDRWVCAIRHVVYDGSVRASRGVSKCRGVSCLATECKQVCP